VSGKSARRAARSVVADYHQAQLGNLSPTSGRPLIARPTAGSWCAAASDEHRDVRRPTNQITIHGNLATPTLRDGQNGEGTAFATFSVAVRASSADLRSDP
jgi:hypothetical protein